MRISSDAAAIGVVAIGGMIGALTRWVVVMVLPFGVVDTLVVNLVGCSLIGLGARRLTRRDSLMWNFSITGILGGFTTFSTFTVEAQSLLRDEPIHAAAYIVVTLTGATTATIIARGRS